MTSCSDQNSCGRCSHRGLRWWGTRWRHYGALAGDSLATNGWIGDVPRNSHRGVLHSLFYDRAMLYELLDSFSGCMSYCPSIYRDNCNGNAGTRLYCPSSTAAAASVAATGTQCRWVQKGLVKLPRRLNASESMKALRTQFERYTRVIFRA